MANLKHVHPDGRECTFDADDSIWMYTTKPNRFLAECSLEHPVAERAAEDDDRGDFGMPTLGHHVMDMPENNPRVIPYRKTVITLTDGRLSFNHGDKGYTKEGETPEARLIINLLVGEFLELFLDKNTKYKKVQQGYDLGEAGIIPDLNRKLGILVDRIWDGSHEVGEDTDEVILDLIGHLFLMLAKRRLPHE